MGGHTEQKGFAGSLAAFSVADLLQFQGNSGFSGSIAFSNEGREAVIYLHQGEVVHAECDGHKGEAAIRALLAWPSGNFQAHANVSTFARTIDKRLDHLLIESLRSIDEARRDTPAPLATPVPAGPPPLTQRPKRALPGSAERVLTVPGTTYAAVIQGGAAVRDPSPRAEALVARGQFLLSMISAPLGKALGLGELSRAALSSQQGEQLLLFRAQDAYLAVAVAPGVPLPETENAIRHALRGRTGD